MGQRQLSPGGCRATAQQGFTIIEIMTAMVVTITVMLANLYLFNIAHGNLSQSRALTAATNLAAGKVAEFRGMTIAQIKAAAPESTPTRLDGIDFTRTWVVTDVDLNSDGTAEMVGDVVKIRLDVSWDQSNKVHHVAIATFTTGKGE